jgi:hypothetical protein
MNLTRTMSRRQLLGLATGGGLALAAAAFRRTDEAQTRRARWLSAVGQSESHRVVGRAYLASLPAAPDVADLLSEILPKDPTAEASRLESPGELRRYLQRRIEDDFDRGRIVRVRGWVLADTEARLAALSVVL